jgi:hypothetical protein
MRYGLRQLMCSRTRTFFKVTIGGQRSPRRTYTSNGTYVACRRISRKPYQNQVVLDILLCYVCNKQAN